MQTLSIYPATTAAGERPPCFRVLGLLQADGAAVTARRQQVVLALLLLKGNRVVSLETLVHALWGETPPATARAQVQTCVSALRRQLGAAGLGERIRVRGLGYAFELTPSELDLNVFENLVGRARAAQRPEAARAAFREALALWRGEALTGIESEVVQAQQVRLAQRRIEVLEDCLDVELGLGLHREIVGELSLLVEENPLRERLVRQLMTALNRCGRRVEALAVYRSVRQRYVDELGLEPSASVTRLHQDILTGSAAPSPAEPAATRPVPRMLPARVSYFTGHAGLLAALRARLSGDRGPDAALVAVLTGRGGVGKSTVAVEAAHELAPEFPDGQLYARMTDHNGRPEDVGEVLARFLRALGLATAEIPDDVESRAALYRSVLAGRRVLTVLEDAVDETQIRALVPGTPASRLIMTTRARTAALPGSAVFELDVLGTEEGIELLAAMVGRERVNAELSCVIELVGLCGGLQLALSGAVAWLAARPNWTFAHIVARLRGDQDRLDQLSHRGIDVRASLRRDFQALPPAGKRLFARLGLLETSAWADWTAAPLLDLPPEEAADVLETLLDARLVDVACGTGATTRYRLHELARIYAREQLAHEPADERAAVLRRLFGAWLCLTDKAVGRAAGDAERWELPRPLLDAVVADPAAWYSVERPALLATVRHMARAEESGYCWNLALVVVALGRPADGRECAEIALRTTVHCGDRVGEAMIRSSLDAREPASSRARDWPVRSAPRTENRAAARRNPVRQFELVAEAAEGAIRGGGNRTGYRTLPRPRPILYHRNADHQEEA